jgi:hypothetical protein
MARWRIGPATVSSGREYDIATGLQGSDPCGNSHQHRHSGAYSHARTYPSGESKSDTYQDCLAYQNALRHSYIDQQPNADRPTYCHVPADLYAERCAHPDAQTDPNAD